MLCMSLANYNETRNQQSINLVIMLELYSIGISDLFIQHVIVIILIETRLYQEILINLLKISSWTILLQPWISFLFNFPQSPTAILLNELLWNRQYCANTDPQLISFPICTESIQQSFWSTSHAITALRWTSKKSLHISLPPPHIPGYPLLRVIVLSLLLSWQSGCWVSRVRIM